MLFAATWIELEVIILSLSGREKYHTIPLICGIQNNTNEFIYKQKHTHREQTCGWQREAGEG